MADTFESFVEGEVILIDKPLGWTSFDVVNYIRNFFRKGLGLGKVKTGHAGTLDPLATGLLILCTGKATKRMQEFQDMAKTYLCTMDFSATTPSYDLETPFDKQTPCEHLTENIIRQSLSNFHGDIRQVPPNFSAIKVEGKRAYHHARESSHVELESRALHIERFELCGINLPKADFIIECSKGTYIRALARDLGVMVGAGAYLIYLRRIKIGEYSVEDAETPEHFCSRLRALSQNPKV